MGKGDKKSKRGKIVLGTYGVRRPRKKGYKASIRAAASGETNEKVTAGVKEPRAQREKISVKEQKPVREKPEKSLKNERADKEVRKAKEASQVKKKGDK